MIHLKVICIRKDMQPGDPIGIISIQEIMRGATQSNLSSFHSAGLKSDRPIGKLPIHEVLDVSEKGNFYTPITIKDVFSFKKFKLRRKIKYYILGYEIPKEKGFWNMDPEGVSVRFYVNYKKLLEDCRDLSFLKDRIEFKTAHVVKISSDFVGIMDISFKGSINREIWEIINIQLGIEYIHDCSEKGILGSNMVEMMKMEDIDRTSVISNNIRQVEKVLGIEAARWVIYNELGGGPIIADMMTHFGKVHPFNKSNPILKSKGILTSMSFERFGRDMENISEFNIDKIDSVYSQSILGVVSNMGSNDRNFKLIPEGSGN